MVLARLGCAVRVAGKLESAEFRAPWRVVITCCETACACAAEIVCVLELPPPHEGVMSIRATKSRTQTEDAHLRFRTMGTSDGETYCQLQGARSLVVNSHCAEFAGETGESSYLFKQAEGSMAPVTGQWFRADTSNIYFGRLLQR
jgi:hypothetical protein